MTTKTIQYLDDKGLMVSEYAEKLLDMIKLPEDGTVSMIILGYDNGPEIMKAHFEPLTDQQLLDPNDWWNNADVHADTYGKQFDALIEAAKHRWPKVRIFRVPGCLCCNGIDGLLDYDCEL